jgi:hypothetical protein
LNKLDFKVWGDGERGEGEISVGKMEVKMVL